MRRPARDDIDDSSRPGFTLLEMLLVLAILVAITAVTIPVVERMYDTHRIRQAAMQVRTALAAARLRAVDQGEMVECRFEPDGRQLMIRRSADQGIRFGDDAANSVSSATQRRSAPLRVELPEPLYFWTADNARQRLQAGDLQEFADDKPGLPNRMWSAPIVFAPHGSSSDAQFEIRDPQGRTVQLDVRGLTGAASSSRQVQRRGG